MINIKKKLRKMEIKGIIGAIMLVGFIVINMAFSKRDGRFKNGLKPQSLSLKGWIIQLIWLSLTVILAVVIK